LGYLDNATWWVTTVDYEVLGVRWAGVLMAWRRAEAQTDRRAYRRKFMVVILVSMVVWVSTYNTTIAALAETVRGKRRGRRCSVK
jgi:hypothetical protein